VAELCLPYSLTSVVQSSRLPAAQVVFAEAWWIGTKESNPDEERLPVPESVLQAGAIAAGAGVMH